MKLGKLFTDALPPESRRPALPPSTEPPRMWIVTRVETRTTRTVWLSNDPVELGEGESGIFLAALSDDVDTLIEPPVELSCHDLVTRRNSESMYSRGFYVQVRRER